MQPNGKWVETSRPPEQWPVFDHGSTRPCARTCALPVDTPSYGTVDQDFEEYEFE